MKQNCSSMENRLAQDQGVNEYRLRWDDVVYQPGELKAIAYRGGKPWAQDAVKTTGAHRQGARRSRPFGNPCRWS